MEQAERERFEAAALPHLDIVYRTLLRMTRDPHTAQDLTQETYLRALRSFGSFQPGSNCRAWLLRIAHNLWVDETRHRKHLASVHRVAAAIWYDRGSAVTGTAATGTGEEDHRAGADPLAELPDRDPGPEEQALRELDRESLQRALAQLPEEFRLTVTLVDINQLTCAEAAEAMEVPRGTVLSRLHRGRGKLRQLLLSERSLGADEM
jgi:RNA polymerase sigma-70 factor, ECF subfamily